MNQIREMYAKGSRLTEQKTTLKDVGEMKGASEDKIWELQKAVEDGTKTFDEALSELSSIKSNTGRVAQGQLEANKELRQLVRQTAPVGLEQAMALWAGGVGKASGYVPSKGFGGSTRAEYENKWRSLWGLSSMGHAPAPVKYQKMLQNTSQIESLSNINKMNSFQNSSQSYNSTVGNVIINTPDGNPAEIGRHFTDVVQTNLRNIVNRFSDGRVS
jgi:hypothetical protein